MRRLRCATSAPASLWYLRRLGGQLISLADVGKIYSSYRTPEIRSISEKTVKDLLSDTATVQQPTG